MFELDDLKPQPCYTNQFEKKVIFSFITPSNVHTKEVNEITNENVKMMYDFEVCDIEYGIKKMDGDEIQINEFKYSAYIVGYQKVKIPLNIFTVASPFCINALDRRKKYGIKIVIESDQPNVLFKAKLKFKFSSYTNDIFEHTDHQIMCYKIPSPPTNISSCKNVDDCVLRAGEFCNLLYVKNSGTVGYMSYFMDYSMYPIGGAIFKYWFHVYGREKLQNVNYLGMSLVMWSFYSSELKFVQTVPPIENLYEKKRFLNSLRNWQSLEGNRIYDETINKKKYLNIVDDNYGKQQQRQHTNVIVVEDEEDDEKNSEENIFKLKLSEILCEKTSPPTEATKTINEKKKWDNNNHRKRKEENVSQQQQKRFNKI